MKVNKIETKATLPDGRVFESYYSFPQGLEEKPYRKLIDKFWNSFPEARKHARANLMKE